MGKSFLHTNRYFLVPLMGIIVMILPVRALTQELPEFDMSDTTVTVCEGILYDSGGEDDIYGNNENTTFVINTGGIITITFFGQLCLENNLDFLYVYDGPDDNSPLLGVYTGNTLPPVLVANGGVVTLVLTSDQNVAYCGFAMEWETEQPIPIPPTISVLPVPNCNAQTIQVNFSYAIGCWWWDDAEVTLTSNGNEIALSGTDLQCIGDSADYVNLLLEEPLIQNCPYEISIEIGIPDDCELIYIFTLTTTFDVETCPVNVTLTADPPEICPGSCSEILAQVNGCFTYTYAWNNGLPPSAGPHNVCPLVTTTYTVTITEIETSIVTSSSITIPVTTTAITTPDFTTCQSGDPVDLESQTNNGTWSGDGIVDEETGMFEPDSASAGINVIYFETDACLDSMFITITPIATENVVAACPGSPDFQLNGIPGGGTWTGPFTTTPGIFSPTTIGSYTVIYEVNGCTDELIVNVDDITGTFELDTLCQSTLPFILDFAPLGGTFSGPGITNPLTGEFSPEQSTPGDVILLYEVEGCDQEFHVFIKEIYIDGSHTACPEEDPLIWNPNPVPPGGYWAGDGVIDTTTGLYDPSLFPNDSYTYIVYYAPNGCSDTTFIYNLQTIVLADTIQFCAGDDNLVLNFDNVGNAPESGGEWIGAGVVELWDDHWEFDPSTAGIGSHTLVYLKNNCADSLVAIVFPDQLNAGPNSYCANEADELLVPGLQQGGLWSGNGIIDPVSGLFDPDAASPGNFYVYWNTNAGCTDSISIFVDEFLQASVTGLSGVLCFEDTSYVLTVDPPGGVLTGAESDFTFNPAIAGEGEHEIIYEFVGAECQSSDTLNVLIYDQITTTITASDTLICQGESVTITVNAEGGNPNEQLQYQWSNGGFPFNSTTYAPQTSETVYVITYDECSDPILDSVYIEVLPEMLVETVTSDTLCFGIEGFAMASVLNVPSYSVEWDNVAGETINAPAGTAHDLLVTDLINGCEFDSVVLIPSYSPITANFSINPNEDCIPFDDADNITIIDLSVNAVSGTWIIGQNEIPYVFGENPNLSEDMAGQWNVTLFVFNEGNCPDTAFGSICVLPPTPVFIPDIFSPNNDGHNDMLFVRGQGIVNMEFLLYNRWGEKVFACTDVDDGWDGVYRGKPAPDGVYVYYFKALLNDGSNLEEKGDITLIR